jgi:L-malate glycosyltransferase
LNATVPQHERSVAAKAGGAPWSVLLVGPLPPPSGGIANQTQQLAGLLANEGCRVIVERVNAPYRPAWIESLRGIRALFRVVPYVFRLWRNAGRVDLVHVMANSGWAWHFFAAPAIVIARMRGKPVIVNYRGGAAETFLARQSRWVSPTLKRASAVIVPSPFLEGVFARWGVVAQLVPNVVDLARFTPGERHEGPPHLIVTRNLEDIYDVPTALAAFVRIRQEFAGARLTIAGSGPCRDKLERLASELGIAEAVRFTGRIDNRSIHDLYRSADVLLNPSLVDNTPISLLEAMASGVPIVSTNVGGIPYLVRDGETALLVPAGDPDAMARATTQLLGDVELYRRLRAGGLNAAQAYTWERVRVRLFDVYERALSAPVPEECPS